MEISLREMSLNGLLVPIMKSSMYCSKEMRFMFLSSISVLDSDFFSCLSSPLALEIIE